MVTCAAALISVTTTAPTPIPSRTNAAGAAANLYKANNAQYMVLRVPEERPGPPKADTVDVKVDLPAGWTNPVCLEALTAAGTVPGPVAVGWSCAVEPGTPTVLHWTR